MTLDDETNLGIVEKQSLVGARSGQGFLQVVEN